MLCENACCLLGASKAKPPVVSVTARFVSVHHTHDCAYRAFMLGLVY